VSYKEVEVDRAGQSSSDEDEKEDDARFAAKLAEVREE
jgi:hypothetical protein